MSQTDGYALRGKRKDNSDRKTMFRLFLLISFTFEPPHAISNNVMCATSKAYDQPVHTRSLITVFASRLNIL